MSFELNDTQISIVNSAKNISEKFDDDYWLDCDLNSKFPQEFYEEVASGGWLGMCMPEKFGGSNLGIREASLFMQTISESGGGMAAASSIHINIFGPHPIVIHGTQKQKETWLPPLITGKEKTCFGVTEPDSGLDTGRLKTKAQKVQGGYIINGQKIWTSTAQVANKILLLARTTDQSQTKKTVDEKKNELKNLTAKFKELKVLIYDYKDKKDLEIKDLTLEQNNFKKELVKNKENYEKIIEETTEKIEKCVFLC